MTDETAGQHLPANVFTPEHGYIDIADAPLFDADHPGITRLEADLRNRLNDAGRDAATMGIELHVNSGWRSAALQQRLFDDAVEEYGSREEARRWVAQPGSSRHTTGEAVDIGSWDAATWLGQNGSLFELCQVYGNEPWHFEVQASAVTEGCETVSDDPTAGALQ